jgi:hypothetical protein
MNQFFDRANKMTHLGSETNSSSTELFLLKQDMAPTTIPKFAVIRSERTPWKEFEQEVR